MRLPSQRWLKAVFIATALIFTTVAIYLYGFRFREWIDSDAAVTAILGSKVLAAKAPIVDSFYYANGDVWLAAPHLFAVIPVAIFGLGVRSLLVTVVLGIAVELYVFSRVYTRLCGELWVGIFAAIVTMIAWSSWHVGFEYIQIFYGMFTMFCLLSFTAFAGLANSARPRPVQWVVAGALIAFIAVQNPTRTLVFVYAPILAGCGWPWRGLGGRRRLAIAGVATAGWTLAFIVYAFVFSRYVTFSYPGGHLEFEFVGVDGIVKNLRFLLAGLTMLCGGGPDFNVMSIPGMLVMLGAIVLVCREALRSRTLDAVRFVALVVLAQLGIVLLPLVVGNLLTDTPSVRYVMPSLLAILGLAAILAVRALDDARTWWRRLAIGWLVALPLTAVVAIPDTLPPEPSIGRWADASELDRVADELVRRNLTRGYADVLAADFLTLLTGGDALVCPIYFADFLAPQRWLTDTSCYRRGDLTDRFFIVAVRNDKSVRASLEATLSAPLERFDVGSIYEVLVYRTADTSLAWLDLPLPDNDRKAFPLRIPATHLQLRHANAILDGGRLVATGEPGTVIYGPYIKLPRGRYTVRWTGSGIASPGTINFLVAAEAKDVLATSVVPTKELPTAKGQLAQLSFKLERARPAIELIVRSDGGARVAVDEIVIERR